MCVCVCVCARACTYNIIQNSTLTTTHINLSIYPSMRKNCRKVDKPKRRQQIQNNISSFFSKSLHQNHLWKRLIMMSFWSNDEILIESVVCVSFYSLFLLFFLHLVRFTKSIYLTIYLYQPLRSGRIWHKVNF